MGVDTQGADLRSDPGQADLPPLDYDRVRAEGDSEVTYAALQDRAFSVVEADWYRPLLVAARLRALAVPPARTPVAGGRRDGLYAAVPGQEEHQAIPVPQGQWSGDVPSLHRVR